MKDLAKPGIKVAIYGDPFFRETLFSIKISLFAATVATLLSKVGIRPENIMILRNDKEGRDRKNILHGRIEDIFEKSAYHLIIFRPDNAQRTIKIEIPDYSYRKFWFIFSLWIILYSCIV